MRYMRHEKIEIESKIGGFDSYISIESPVTEEQIKLFITHFKKAVAHIQASPIRFFEEVLKDSIYPIITLGSFEDIMRNWRGKERDAVASYASWANDEGMVFYYTDGLARANIYISLIHEFAHKYHYIRIMDGGYNNEFFKKLYRSATRGTQKCYTNLLPKIGDSLSDLREDWWNISSKVSSDDDYILTSITQYEYIYETKDGKTIPILKESVLERITCPSRYGATDHKEFFAEMITLITLGLVKPNQQVIANKFMEGLAEYAGEKIGSQFL